MTFGGRPKTRGMRDMKDGYVSGTMKDGVVTRDAAGQG